MNLLIVDDHATNIKLLRAQLEAEGHTVLEASDGVQALAILEREPVDGVVSDILMPHMDGYSFCRKVRQHPRFSALPLILYTSTYDSNTDRQLADTVEADGFIIKPAPIRVILEALQAAMQKAGERKNSPSLQPDEGHVLRQYSEVLVRKLEERNTALLESLEKLRLAHEEILELNRDLEQRVRQRTSELAAANKELEAFCYSVSHDLRAPLRHIDGYVQLLTSKAGALLGEKNGRYLSVIAESAKEMGQLIDDLLSFSRMSRAELKLTKVDLKQLSDETIQSLEPDTRSRNIRWIIGELPVVQGDFAMLRQVFANLLGNAVKYTRQRDPAEIEVGCMNGKANETIIFVRDNGAGFDMQYVDKLFGVFQRLHATEDFEGTGIGLANVNRVVTRHGGRCWAEGKVDVGATFYFSLPNPKSA